MPVLLRLANLRVVIYPNDHTPEHVHVIGPEYEAVFELNCEAGGPPSVRENYGFSRAELKMIGKELIESVDMLCAAWERIHESD